MQKRSRILIGAVVLAASVAIPTVAIAIGDSGADSETPITGSELDRAKAAALAHVGEGRVTDTEVGDEESLYEVETTLPDGSQLDVQLDEAFVVVGTDTDEAED